MMKEAPNSESELKPGLGETNDVIVDSEGGKSITGSLHGAHVSINQKVALGCLFA